MTIRGDGPINKKHIRYLALKTVFFLLLLGIMVYSPTDSMVKTLLILGVAISIVFDSIVNKSTVKITALQYCSYLFSAFLFSLLIIVVFRFVIRFT